MNNCCVKLWCFSLRLLATTLFLMKLKVTDKRRKWRSELDQVKDTSYIISLVSKIYQIFYMIKILMQNQFRGQIMIKVIFSYNRHRCQFSDNNSNNNNNNNDNNNLYNIYKQRQKSLRQLGRLQEALLWRQQQLWPTAFSQSKQKNQQPQTLLIIIHIFWFLFCCWLPLHNAF